ncbi:enoyl-CoA hydratase-related protein [Actinokineospora sp. UTMC 2448]|uniref:enoyl-CoA hydratase-related protein n=1 Tax=Actinokineospora sp. UTMC 2448 TaxID=2268449 RepID=UPI00216473B9|nr:enoyl-CoA hydratase-related protein [Actinokineospora sp. UTMC 2448]UVS78619.1 putative enoyl-CoA hydratase echA8 [Actinokineospora sp. UTMC 2448]
MKQETKQGETVLAVRRGPVLVLTLNRPDRLNAWNDELERRYFALLDEAEADPGVRAIVVTGAGRGFCAGADMADLQRIGADEIDSVERPRPRTFPMTVRKPLIAAINGAAAGLGLVEALYCDIRFATPTAKLTTAFVRRGLIAEYGMAWLLPRLVGISTALDLLMSGRVVTGEEARALGLVDRVVEPDALLDAAVDYATELATLCSPESMRIIKEQVRAALDSEFADAVAEADRLMVESFRHPDAAEGVASYLANRPPAFRPLAPR